jgi:hypothetical protein
MLAKTLGLKNEVCLALRLRLRVELLGADALPEFEVLAPLVRFADRGESIAVHDLVHRPSTGGYARASLPPASITTAPTSDLNLLLSHGPEPAGDV